VAFTATGWRVTPLSFVLLRHFTGLGPWRQFVALRGILVSTGLMFLAVVGVQRVLTPFVDQALVLVAGVLVGVLSYTAVISVVDRPLLRSALRDVTRRHRPAGAPS